MDIDEPSGGLLGGACGYGEQNPDDWPFWKVAAVAPNNPLFADESGRNPKLGCGACIEVECISVSEEIEICELCVL